MKTLLSIYLHELHVPFTRTYADTTFAGHPYRDSMYGLSDMLSEYKINNLGIQVDDKDLKELTTPCIVLMSNEFALIKHINVKSVEYVWRNKGITVPAEKFKNLWSGFALVAEPNAESIEPDYDIHRRKEILNWTQKIFLVFLLGGWVLLGFIRNWISLSMIYTLLLLVVCLLGLGITYMLMAKQIRQGNEYVDKICSLFKQGDCNSVLESKAAKLWGIFSWSEIGFSYFVSTFLLLVFYPECTPYLILINWLALPYSFWSVWYQHRVVKQWCPLCLSVMLLLWIMAIIGGISEEWRFVTLDLKDLVSVVVLYLLPFSALHLFWNILSRAEQTENVKYELNSIKASEEVFLHLLRSQPQYDVNGGVSSVLFGNPHAKLCITVLSNPHCNPCAQLHGRIEALLNEMGDRLCVQYIFSSFNKELEKSTRFLIAAYQNEPLEKAKQIYQEWFRGKKYMGDIYMDKFGYDIETTKVISEWDRHYNWQQKYKLSVTPFIIINGYRLPNNYKIEDLKFFENIDVDF